jgi:hypothetical protein
LPIQKQIEIEKIIITRGEIMDYTIVQGSVIADLVKWVKDMIAKGWEPQGGPFIIGANTEMPSYGQALVRNKELG